MPRRALPDKPRKDTQPRYRGTAASRGYDRKWRKRRQAFLRKHPLCSKCQQEGQVTAAVVVDHIEPVEDGQNDPRFFDEHNWQPLCIPHHNAKTQRDRRRNSSQHSN